MNTILLRPTDVLFFRDGRPMSGSFSGHGAAWPMPTVINHAFHAALHRTDLEKSSGFTPHKHVPGRSSQKRDFSSENRENNGRLFGSLSTAGPFPVDPKGNWHFPRPLDAGLPLSAHQTFVPLEDNFQNPKTSSLPVALRHPVANSLTASKDTPEPWFTAAAYAAYLSGEQRKIPPENFVRDSDFSDSEFTYGIAIDPDTGTVDGSGFFNEEVVPPETLFTASVFPTRAMIEESPVITAFREESILQFGGKASTGLGFCTVKIQPRH